MAVVTRMRLPSWRSSSRSYNASGVLLGSQRIRGDLDLDRGGETFATRSVIEVLDLNDAVIGGGCATSAGTRFE